MLGEQQHTFGCRWLHELSVWAPDPTPSSKASRDSLLSLLAQILGDLSELRHCNHHRVCRSADAAGPSSSNASSSISDNTLRLAFRRWICCGKSVSFCRPRVASLTFSAALSDASSILLKEGQPGVKGVSLLRLPSVADSRLQNEVLLQRGRQTGSFRQQRLILFHKILCGSRVSGSGSKMTKPSKWWFSPHQKRIVLRSTIHRANSNWFWVW